MQQMLAEEVAAIVGPRGKHNPSRRASRHGTEDGSVVLGGRRVAIKRPRARTTDGKEVQLETYEAFQDENLLTTLALERMIHGLSTRRYEHGLEPVGTGLPAKGTAKSTVSRRFVQATKKALAELMARPLDQQRYLVLMIDGVEMADHTVVVVLGITADGQKQVLGLREGATENAAVCRALLSDLVERGLQADEGILVVIDGAKALKAAVKKVFGDQAAIQRCLAHKKRNIQDHLPEKEQVWVGRKLDQAWQETDYNRALEAIKRLASSLEETLTVIRLGLPERLRRTLRTTNAIESTFDKVRVATRNVKRWRNGQQVLRWAAAGLLDAEKGFRRIKGYKELPILAAALRKQALPESPTGVKSA
jgi:transposase-like protein